MNKKTVQEEMKSLLIELVSDNITENRQDEIFILINKLSPDPLWSDYIFWSNDYINENSEINFKKLFKKIFDS